MHSLGGQWEQQVCLSVFHMTIYHQNEKMILKLVAYKNIPQKVNSSIQLLEVSFGIHNVRCKMSLPMNTHRGNVE